MTGQKQNSAQFRHLILDFIAYIFLCKIVRYRVPARERRYLTCFSNNNHYLDLCQALTLFTKHHLLVIFLSSTNCHCERVVTIEIPTSKTNCSCCRTRFLTNQNRKDNQNHPNHFCLGLNCPIHPLPISGAGTSCFNANLQ